MRAIIFIIVSLLALIFVAESLIYVNEAQAQSPPLGRFNIIVNYQDELHSYNVLSNVTYTLEQGLLTIHQDNGNKRLIPLYGVKYVRIIRLGGA